MFEIDARPSCLRLRLPAPWISMMAVLSLLAASATADQGVPRRATSASLEADAARIWLWDGDKETYYAFRFLDGSGAVVQAFDPAQPDRWKDAIGYVRNQLPSDGTRTVMVVGPVPSAFVAQVKALEQTGRAKVEVAPDVRALVRDELGAFAGTISVALSAPDDLVQADHVASLLRRADRVVVPTADPGLVRDLVATGKVDAVHVLGDAPPGDLDDLPARQDHAGAQAFLAQELGGTDAVCPVSGPLILAVYTGKAITDSGYEPLSFYDSSTVASALCNNRQDCLLLQLSVLSSEFKLNPPLGMPIGWQVEIGSIFDAEIATYVNSWNLTNPACPITRLAIVAHPLDIPYRRYVMPYKAFCSGWPPYVDYGFTDNTDAAPGRTGACDLDGPPPAIPNPDLPFDGSTPSADFFYADVESSQFSSPVHAELAYGRVAGQTLTDATALVNTDRFKLGIAPNPNRELGDGGRINSTEAPYYGSFETLYKDFYSRSDGNNVQLPCKPPRIPFPEPGYVDPSCPTGSTTTTGGNIEYRCLPMDYRRFDDWIAWLREGLPTPPYEVAQLLGHQDQTYEVAEDMWLPPDPPDIYWTDRQRIQFSKYPGEGNCGGPIPDVHAPEYTTDHMRANGPFDLAATVWMMGASSAGIYNYLDYVVRDPALGPDSSWLSTLPTSGVAAWFIDLSVDPDFTYPNTNYPGIAFWERLHRELTFGDSMQVCSSVLTDDLARVG